MSRIKWAFATFLVLSAPGAHAQDFRFESAGARLGFPAGGSAEGFLQAEAFVDWALPWRWDLGAQWQLDSGLDLSGGWLGAGSVNAAIGSIGPILALGRESFPLSIALGASPTLLSTHDFSTKDFGEDLQFTSHIGINWDITSHLRLGYRFQHMSNAGISDRNPGLNLHVFALSYVF